MHSYDKNEISSRFIFISHDDVIKWEHLTPYRPFVREIHRSPVNSPHKDKGQWRGALMFFLIHGWGNNRQAGDFRRHLAHYDVTVMIFNIRVHDVFYKDYLMQ